MVNNYISTSFKGMCLALFAFMILTLPANAQFTYKTTFGSLGTGNLQFDSPEGVAVGPDGKIYVADRNNDRVQVLNADFTYNTQFGGFGTNSGQFENPVDVAVDNSGNIYVVDRSNQRVQVFNSSYVFQFQIGTTAVQGSGNNEFNFPESVDVDDVNNLIYITDRNNDRVQVYNTSGTYIRTIGVIDYPSEVVVASTGNIFVSAQTTDFVYEYTSAGSLVNSLNGTGGSADGQFNLPAGITLDASDNLYIADRSNDRIAVFNSSLVWQYNITTTNTSGSNALVFPTDLAFDSNGNLLIVEPSEDHVEVFEPLATEPDVTLGVSPASASENGGSATLTVTLSGTYTSDVTVNLSYSGTATGSGVDYSGPASITVTAGNTSNTGTITFVNDAIDEDNETVIVDISSVTNGTESGTQQVTTTIVDDDAAPALSINDITISEGAGTGSFTVALSAASAKTVTVNYATADNTATAGADYTATSGTLTFNPGETSKSINVSLTDDGVDEADETFFVNLSTAANATISDSQGIGTIQDNDAAPTISVNDITVSEGAGTATFTVSLSAASGQTVTVNYATADNTATGGSDFTGTSGTLTFSPGETSKSVNITLIDDGIDEADESFFLNLSGSSNATVSDSQGVATITDNDASPTITVNDISGTESGGGLTFTVSLSASSAQTITVAYATADNTATAGADYTAASGTLTFNPGESSKDLVVTISNDALDEVDETFFLNLSSATNATISDSQGIATILDDDAAPGISINDVTAGEGAGNITFTVSLSAASGQAVTVNYATADNTASAGSDYTSTSGTLTFNAGETSKTLAVSLLDDSTDEPDESFLVNLSGATNASLTDSQGIGTITDNDAAPTVSIDDVSGLEGSGTLTFTVSLSGSSSNTISVDYATANNTASAGSDYTATSGTLTFNPGETSATVLVSLTDDDIDEGDETFFVNLSSPVNTTISDSQGIGTITNDDVSGITLSTTTVSAQENGTNGSYTIVLNSQPQSDVVVSFTTDSQIEAISSVTFTSSDWFTPKTITVVAVNDLIDEANPHTGTIQHTVSSGDANYNGFTVSDVTASIQDDDAAGLFLTATTASVTEDGATDTYRIRLTSEPTATVTISFVTDLQLNTISSITFDDTNWSDLQTVTISAVDDDVAEATHGSIIQHVVSSADPFYDGLDTSGDNVTVIITDNDDAGIVLSKSTVNVSEDGTVSDSYTITLTSEPVEDVVISVVTGADINAIADLTFTPTTWDTPQTVNVSAVDDGVCEGAETVSISHTASSVDGTYNALDLSTETVTVNIADDGPATAAATIDQATQEVCEDTFELSANAPGAGETGLWSSTTAGVTFDTPSNNNTTVNLQPGANIITWTISKGGCEISASITLTNNKVTTTANIVQSDMGICNDFVSLNASAVDAGESGTWSSASGLVNFTPNASSQNVVANDIPVGVDTIYYTVRRGGSTTCDPSVDFVRIVNYNTTAQVNTADTEVCDGTASLSAVSAPTGITGTWTGPAGAVFSPDANSANVTVSNIPAGDQVFTWTLDLATCGSSSDQVTITNNEVTTVAAINTAAGEICASTLSLSANTPASGETGTWTGPAGATFDDANSPTATASNIPSGNVTFTWTISRGACTPSVATVDLTNNEVQSTVNIMTTDNTESCDGTVSLSATTPVSGENGLWTTSGTAIIVSPTSATTNVTSLDSGDNMFTWTVTRGGCSEAVQVTIVNNELQANAAITTAAQEVCASSFALEANTPATGETGTWTGPAGVTFADANSPSTTVSNLVSGDNLLEWTISRGGCSSVAQVTLTNNTVNTTAQITSPGADTEVCSNSISLTATAADTGNGETGQWTGPAGVIFNPSVSSNNVTVTNLLAGDNVFTWTISKGGCTPSEATVTITNNEVLSTATILTPSQSTCDTSLELQANAIAAGETGTWSGPAGVTFSPSANDRNATAENLVAGQNKIYWSVGRGTCDPSVDSLTITRNEPVAIVTNPENKVLCPGDQLVLTVESTGTEPFTYEWRKNGVSIPGANQQTLTIDDITASNAGSYTVTVDNTCGASVVSEAAVVTVNDPVQVTLQPQTDITCENGDISFTVAATGTGVILQWQENDNSGWSDLAEGGIYSGTQSETLTISGVPVGLNGYQYRMVATGDCGSLTSDPATLQLYDPLTAGTIADNQEICFNTQPDQLLTLTAATGGDGTYNYQWLISGDNVNFTDIAGATSENYQPDVLSSTTYYQRRVTAGSSCGTALSNVITIDVLPGTAPGTIGSDQTICFNTAPAVLTSVADASGGGTLSYQWEESLDGTLWDEIIGANAAGYAPGALTITTSYRRKVIFNGGGCGEEYSNTVTVNVFNDLDPGEIGPDQVIASTESPAPILSIAPAQGGSGTFDYQWQESLNGTDWSDIVGEVGESYTPSNTVTTFFRRTVTSGAGCGSAISNEVLIRVNNAPFSQNIAINLDEDVPFNLAEAVFQNVYTDADNDPLTSVRVETLPSNGELQLNGVPVFAGDVIDVADLVNLFYIPVADYNGADQFAFSLGDGTEFSSVSSLDLNVRPVNDAPVITAVPDIVIGVGENIPTAIFTVTDVDNLPSELTVSVSSDNPTLINTLDLGNNGSSDYTLVIRVNNGAGTAEVTITATDGEATTTETFVFELQPRITDVPNLLILSGSARNRTWGISHFGITDQVSINVYDESGTVLFETTNPSEEWDGTFNGNEVSSGIYYYTIEINGRDEVLQGALKVIK